MCGPASFVGVQIFVWHHCAAIFLGWPENTDPRSVDPLRTGSMDYLMDQSTDPLYRPPFGPPPSKKKIVFKKIDLTFEWTDGVHVVLVKIWMLTSAELIQSCNVIRLGLKVILIVYCHLFCCDHVWDVCCEDWSNYLCFRLHHLFGLVSSVRDHKLDPGFTKNNATSPFLWEPSAFKQINVDGPKEQKDKGD